MSIWATHRAPDPLPLHGAAQSREQWRLAVASQLSLEKGEDSALDPAELGETVGEHILGAVEQYLYGGAGEVAVEDDRVDVALAADGGRVAEPFGDTLDGGDEITLRLGLAREALKLSQRECREHGSRPGAKVFGGELVARDLAEVAVDVVGRDALLLAVFAEVLEENLPGQVLRAAHDGGELRVVQLDVVALAGFAFEVELESTAPDSHVAVAQRREPDRAVGLSILFVADAYER